MSRMPFRWTVNPYRGCSHACSYCLAPATPVLLADGTQRPIGELRVGDEIVGTAPHGAYRRYVRTRVLDRWTTRKRAYRVTLADGTRLVASGDHRFLTERGWRHVVGGAGHRARLALGDVLVGPGAAALADGRPVLDGQDVTGGEALRVDSLEALDGPGETTELVDITTGTRDFVAAGVVSHNCFARPTHEYLDLDAGEDFDREVVVKVNVDDVLRAELARPSWAREAVALGTNTDPYQRAEGRYRLMPGIIDALAGSGTPLSVLTKGTLLRRDLPLLVDAASRVEVGIGVSLALLDPELQASVEPGTPSPRARLDLVRTVRRPVCRAASWSPRCCRGSPTRPARSPTCSTPSRTRARRASRCCRCTSSPARASGTWAGSRASTRASSLGTSACTPAARTPRRRTGPGCGTGCGRYSRHAGSGSRATAAPRASRAGSAAASPATGTAGQGRRRTAPTRPTASPSTRRRRTRATATVVRSRACRWTAAGSTSSAGEWSRSCSDLSQASARRAGKPPVATGPQRVIVSRTSDLPWVTIAARYSSQSGCSPPTAR